MSNYRQDQGRSQRPQTPPIDLSKVIFKPTEGKAVDPELFNKTAEKIAQIISQERGRNEQTQIRKFYEEIVMWDEKVIQDPDKLPEYLPFIRMMNAKATYAQGRKHVDANFVKLIEKCVSQVDSAETMRHFKYFFEAFVSFYKLVKSK